MAISTSASRLILDDQRGRSIAANLQIPITSTVGIVLRAKQQGLLPLVQPVFEDLRHAGFGLSDSLFQQALKLAGE